MIVSILSILMDLMEDLRGRISLWVFQICSISSFFKNCISIWFYRGKKPWIIDVWFWNKDYGFDKLLCMPNSIWWMRLSSRALWFSLCVWTKHWRAPFSKSAHLFLCRCMWYVLLNPVEVDFLHFNYSYIAERVRLYEHGYELCYLNV